MQEQAKWTGWYKVVKPVSDVVKMQDNMTLDSSAYSNYSWYQRLVHGSSSRFTRYQEFDTMDQDVDVARALDLIAEEMTNVNPKTRLILDLNIETDPIISIPSNVVSTLRVALKHWYSQRGFATRMFKIARNTIKYGDLFCRRINGGTHKEVWEYLPCKNVIGAIVDEHDVTKILGWQVRSDIKKPKTNVGGVVSGQQEYSMEILPASDIIRFSLNDDMSDQAPFGESVLSTVYRVHKQKELLEDAIVIYRVQRAPERRVFYIDVGKMPPNRTKQFLEQIKNEIKQKKVPSMNGGASNMDSTYNPQSMSEDFFFASRPNGNNSRVETLPGGQNLGELTDLEYFRQKVLEGLRIPPSFLPNFQTSDLNASFSDGNVGVAYMPEIIFYRYVIRLQFNLNEILDAEFKRFLRSIDLRIDPDIFKISLPLPTNFEKYKQAAVDAAMLGSFGNADGVQYLSKRFILSRYLGLTPTEIATNEALLAQERGLDSSKIKSMIQLYNPDLLDTDSGDDMGGGLSGMGGISDMGDNSSIDELGNNDDSLDTSDEDTNNQENDSKEQQ